MQKKKMNPALIVLLAIIAIAVAVGLGAIGAKFQNAVLTGFIEGAEINQNAEFSDDKKDNENKTEDSTEEKTQKPTKDSGEEKTTASGNNNQQELSDMTVIVYMIGSNLEREHGYVTRDMQEMIDADLGDNLNIVIQAGGCSDWQNSTLKDGNTHRILIKDAGYKELANLGKVNMTKEETLSDFIKFAVSKYPAKKYTLIMWNHGGGIPMSYGSDDMYPGQNMTDVELKAALTKANVHFETVVFNACLMGTLEVAMSVKDHADYMVAAESTILGGFTYERWLEYIAQNPNSSAKTHCKVLMTDYMNMIQRNKLVSCVSMIDLSKINNVYKAYDNYAASVYTNIMQNGYVNYCKMRSSCGEYKGSDSVDLITLANTYKTSKSTALVNAVKAAVVYSDSDYLYGHGLAAYSPHKDISLYTNGRKSLVSLGYSENILNYYDAYCSIALKYSGDANVNRYGGTWYDVAAVNANISSGQKTEPGKYKLKTAVKNGYNVVALSDDDWKVVDSVEIAVLLKSDNEYLMLGQDYHYDYDADNYIKITLPENWVHINGMPAAYVCVDKYENEETGKWSEYGTIFAKCNGKDVLMMVYYSDEYPKGIILGYANYDFETQTGESYIYRFKDTDVINLIHPIIATNGSITYKNIANVNIKASDLKLTYQSVNFEGYSTAAYIEVKDIYGNEYQTGMFEFN